ncbi:MAG: hypothetical protein OXC99_01480 [Chloroflexi bacterium]|nr:hypothetical protein [Chloroflexota bacterium]
MQYLPVITKGTALVMVAFVVVVIASVSCASPEDKARDYFADSRITQSELNVACRYFWAHDLHYYNALAVAKQVAEDALPDQGPSRIALVMGHFETVLWDFVLPDGFIDERIAEIEDTSGKVFRAWGQDEWATYTDSIAAEAGAFLDDFCFGYLRQ